MDSLTIDGRFCGPPGMGNGGYVSGRLAGLLGSSVAVTLRAPTPLDKPLAVERTADTVSLRDGDTLVAEARVAALELEAPAPPAFVEAERARQAFRGYRTHLFPRCFVCGPARAEGDGLRIFPLPAHARGVMLSAAWRPDPALGDAEGRVRAEYLWGALDCPGGFTIDHAEGTMIFTAGIHGRIEHRPPAGAACVVIGWPIARAGRKHTVGAAVFAADGTRCALGRALWIEVPPKGTPS